MASMRKVYLAQFRLYIDLEKDWYTVTFLIDAERANR